MKFSPKQAHVVFAVIMVGTMTFIMTGVTSFVNFQFTLQLARWMHNWLLAYAVALPIMMLLSPPLRKAIARITAN